MKLRNLLSLISSVAQKHHISTPYICGGIVRDKVNFDKPFSVADLDLTTGNKDVKNLAKETQLALGKQFAVTSKIMNDGHTALNLKNLKIDFSSNFRDPQITSQLKSKGISHPTPLQEEMFSRDFTVNALLMDLNLNKILDPTKQGLQDVKNKILRTCLPPEITLTSNLNRIPRVIYLAAKLGFKVEPNIIAWIKNHPEFVAQVNPTYFKKTLNKAISYNKDITVQLLDEMQLWKLISIPEALYPDYAKRFIKQSQLRTNYDYGEGLYFGEMDRYKSVDDFLGKMKKRKKKLLRKIKNKKAYLEGAELETDPLTLTDNPSPGNIVDDLPSHLDIKENKNPDGTLIKKKKTPKSKEEKIPKQEPLLQPNSLFDHVYVSAPGVEGHSNLPVVDYSGSVAEQGYNGNPYNNLYQQASQSSNDLLTATNLFYNFIKNAGNTITQHRKRGFNVAL